MLVAGLLGNVAHRRIARFHIDRIDPRAHRNERPRAQHSSHMPVTAELGARVAGDHRRRALHAGHAAESRQAIEHLDDVFGVLATAEPVVLGVFIAAVLTAVGVGCASGRRTFGTVLLCAGLGTIALFAILGIWAAIDFEGLFAVFHSLFFAQGSWVFSADSLLITMYPEPFWIGMGAIWLATTIAVSAVSAIAGFALRHA